MLQDTIKVSVTIPVFNTSKYLKKCLDSLCTQTLKDIEFIIVDDGSTDDSGKICDEYAKRDSRFKVIHQSNGGLAVARQTGLDAAKGEYVIVCDSDDWVEVDIYEKLYKTAKLHNADIVCCDYYTEYNDGRSIPNEKKFKVSSDNFIDNNDYTYHGAGNSWVQLIRRDLFTKNNITYAPGINLGEDALIVLKLMKLNPRVVKLNEKLYHYRRLFGENTYTNNISNKQLQQLYIKYYWIKDNYRTKEFENMVYSYALSIVFTSLRSKDIDISQFKEFLSKEITWRTIFFKRKSLKSLVAIASKILPYDIIRLILKPLYPIFYK